MSRKARIRDEEKAEWDKARLAMGQGDIEACFNLFSLPEACLIADTIELFARARIVVGVHGGALSNVLFCPKGALLVELTVDSPYTRHYEHAAVALGLEYVGIPLVRDERGVGANDVRIDDVGHDAVRDAVATYRFPQP